MICIILCAKVLNNRIISVFKKHSTCKTKIQQDISLNHPNTGARQAREQEHPHLQPKHKANICSLLYISTFKNNKQRTSKPHQAKRAFILI